MLRGVIDIGNSSIKTALFSSEGKLLETTKSATLALAHAYLQKAGASSIMCSSVAEQEKPDLPGLIYLDYKSQLPFENHYNSQQTLGLDRLAAMSAAACIYPGKPVLVFDIGTCMTIDFLHPDARYFGGNISPGLQMRLQAMHQLTQRLPLVKKEEAEKTLGTDTRSAIASGAITGMQHEIKGYHRQFSEQFTELITVLCGGDSMHFDIPSKKKIFAAQNFVLQGLYHLLLLNEK